MKYLDYSRRVIRLSCLLLACLCCSFVPAANAASTLRVLFLGDEGHHRPAERFKQLQPVLAKKGVELVYTDKLDDLNAAKLAGYDALAIYANWTRIAPQQEQAMLEFVER